MQITIRPYNDWIVSVLVKSKIYVIATFPWCSWKLFGTYLKKDACILLKAKINCFIFFQAPNSSKHWILQADDQIRGTSVRRSVSQDGLLRSHWQGDTWCIRAWLPRDDVVPTEVRTHREELKRETNGERATELKNDSKCAWLMSLLMIVNEDLVNYDV